MQGDAAAADANRGARQKVWAAVERKEGRAEKEAPKLDGVEQKPQVHYST